MKYSIIFILLIPVFGYSQNTVDLYTVPSNMVLAPNEESSFYVMMDNPSNEEVDGVEIYMNFDAQSLEIMEVTKVYNWTFDLNNIVDDVNGVLTYAGGTLQNPPTTSLTLLKIKVKVKPDATPTSFVFEFDRTFPKECEVAKDGFGILDQSTSLSIQILEECPEVRTITHSPIIDGIFSAGTSIIMSDNIEIANSAVLNCQTASIPESLTMTSGTELRVTPNNCVVSNL
jgi:hypothetical protein